MNYDDSFCNYVHCQGNVLPNVGRTENLGGYIIYRGILVFLLNNVVTPRMGKNMYLQFPTNFSQQ